MSPRPGWLEGAVVGAGLVAFAYDPGADRFVAGGERLAALHGLEGGEVDLARRLRTVHREDRPRLAEAYARLVQDGGKLDLTYRAVGAEGSTRHLRERAARRDNDPEITGVLEDVTDAVRELDAARAARRAATAMNARLAAAAEAITSGLEIIAPDGKIVYLNQRYRDLLPPAIGDILKVGVAADDLLDQALARGPVYHADMGPGFAARRKAARRQPESDVDIRMADGRWLRVRVSPLPDGGRVVLATDVSDRRQSEQSLRASEARFRAVIDALPAVIHLKDEALRYVLANRYYLDQWGLEVGDLIGRTQQEVFSGKLGFAWSRATDDRDARVLRTGEATGFYEVRVPVEGARDMVLFANKLPLRDEAGRISHLLTVGIDITALKRAQEEIERQQDALHQSEKLKALGSMLASVAHELNNPLSVVLGYATMLSEQAPDGASQARAARVRAAAERCARIVRTFLAMVRQKPDVRGPVRIEEVVAGALEVAGYGFSSAGIDCEVVQGENLPEITGDGDQLTLVLMNLIVNAQQAVQQADAPGRVTISSRALTGAIEIEVIDNGPGIPEATRERIFEPFFTTKPEGAGTGIGLAVSKGIVEAHGGTLTAANRAEGGSVFTVRLPLAPTLGAVAETAPAPARQPARARILVIDDEPEVRQLLVEILERHGHTVETAVGGREALALLDGRAIDLIVSDLRMPDLDGPGLYAELAARRPELLSRLLFITGASLAPDIAAFVRASGVDVLEKPFEPEAILARIQTRLDDGFEP